ncbi:hypothetical protein ACQEVS_00960 [Streptomyces sp. CA-181903]|uniref:hypothetical protein n=1 Tax=Streptomyces sp. CA-181903 TaxID=3240055 RepID=UPI003D9412E1
MSRPAREGGGTRRPRTTPVAGGWCRTSTASAYAKEHGARSGTADARRTAVYDFITHDLFGNLLSALLITASAPAARRLRDGLRNAVTARRPRRRHRPQGGR